MKYKNRFFELPQNRVWRSYLGGRILDELAGKSEPCDSHFPEDWIASVTAASNPDSQNELEGISTVQLDDQAMLFTELIVHSRRRITCHRRGNLYGRDHGAIRFGCTI